MPFRIPSRVEYEPYPAASLLREMKNYSSLMLDLAYYSVLYGDEATAYKVLKIEDEVDRKWHLCVMQLMLAARSPREAEALVHAVSVANALNEVSDAAGDIARIALELAKGARALAPAVFKSEELVARIEVKKLPKKLTIEELTSFPRHADVLLLARGAKSFIEPSPSLELQVGDELVVRGTEEAVAAVAELVGYDLKLPCFKAPAELDEKASSALSKVLQLKNAAEVALDMAFYSVTHEDAALALEVLEVEEEVDGALGSVLIELFESEKLTPEEKAALATLVDSLEEVSDAAAKMAGIAVAGFPVSELMELVEEGSNEVLLRAVVGKKLSGATINDAKLDDVGAHVVALKSRERGWIPLPGPSTKLSEGDVLILKVYTAKDERLLEALRLQGLEIAE